MAGYGLWRSCTGSVNPVVAAGPGGGASADRLYLCGAEAEALGVMGATSVVCTARSWPAGSSWASGPKQHSVWRAQRKAAVTAVSSSRWAGAITRAVEDQYQLGLRGLGAEVADLRAAVTVLQAAARCDPAR